MDGFRSNRFTEREAELFEMLALRVRMATIDQIARIWWSEAIHPQAACAASLRKHIAAGELIACHAAAPVLPVMDGPEASWFPGQFAPDMGKLAWSLKQRWTRAAAPKRLLIATRTMALRYGGLRKGTIPRVFQVTHDLAVTEMFLSIRRENRHWTKLWIDEDRLAPFRRGEKLPDAVLAESPSATPQLVLEVGSGTYGKRRLLEFHDDCEARGLPYRIY